MDKLKLFIVGEPSPDPDKWSELRSWGLVIAHTPEEALKLSAEYGGEPVTEIPFDEPKVLYLKDSGRG